MTPIEAAMHAHRSIRRYRDEPVPEALLEEVLQAGIRASSSGNMQAYSVVVTRDPALRERLYEPHMKQEMVREAPVLLTFCADFHRMRLWLELSRAAPNFDNLMSFLIAAIDAVLVSQNVALAAEARGLGICFMGSTLANCDQLVEVLELPEGVMPVVGFSLGWPAEDPAPRDRLPLDALVHRETYRRPEDAEVAAAYAAREAAGWARYQADPALRRKVEEAGVENLAQLYTQVKYTRESHLGYSRTVLETLVRQGFWNHEVAPPAARTAAPRGSPAGDQLRAARAFRSRATKAASSR